MSREEGPQSAWDMPNPYVRLWLTVALGLLGMFLFPVEQGFAPHAFAHARGVPLFAWLGAAFGGVWLLRRAEKEDTPGVLFLLMGVALALSRVIPAGFGGMQPREGRDMAGFALFCLILMLLIVGASVIQLRARPGKGSLRECLLRGPAIALTAPLLLFAARPTSAKRSASLAHGLSGAVLSALPLVLAAGFALPFFFGVLRYPMLASRVGLPWQSFTVWACLGCALLFVLSPWPENPRILKRNGFSKARKRASLATVAFVAVVLLQMVILREYLLFLMFFHPAFIWGGIGCALAVVLVPWPEYPALPKLDSLPSDRKMNPLSTALFLAMALVPLGAFAYGPFLHVVSGRLFTAAFDPAHTGGALDQPSLNKWFFLAVFFSAMTLPHAAAARWMANRQSRWGYWMFVIPTTALCLFLLGILTLPCFWLIQYIGAMGWTVTRAFGLLWGLAGFATLLAFLCWAVWPCHERETD